MALTGVVLMAAMAQMDVVWPALFVNALLMLAGTAVFEWTDPVRPIENVARQALSRNGRA